MTRTIAMILLLGIPGIPLLASCDDPNEPPADVSARIGHAAPGAGPYTVAINGVEVARDFSLGDRLAVVLKAGTNTVVLAGPDGSSLEYDTGMIRSGGLIGYVLGGPAGSATLGRVGRATLEGDGAVLGVVSAVYGTDLTMWLRTAGPQDTTRIALGDFLELSGGLILSPGVYSAAVLVGDDVDHPDQVIDLGQVTLTEGPGWIAVAPDATGAMPASVVVF